MRMEGLESAARKKKERKEGEKGRFLRMAWSESDRNGQMKS
jgi:hypothetical protein